MHVFLPPSLPPPLPLPLSLPLPLCAHRADSSENRKRARHCDKRQSERAGQNSDQKHLRVEQSRNRKGNVASGDCCTLAAFVIICSFLAFNIPPKCCRCGNRNNGKAEQQQQRHHQAQVQVHVQTQHSRRSYPLFKLIASQALNDIRWANIDKRITTRHSTQREINLYGIKIEYIENEKSLISYTLDLNSFLCFEH